MNLNYKILWFEDTLEVFETLSRRTARYIEQKNLICEIERIESANDFDISKYNLNKYELLIIDLKLGDQTRGYDVIKEIRNGKYYNDVLFYSSVGYQKIEEILKEYGLQGVFISDKDNAQFIPLLEALVDKSIRRAESLINIRGIVMDNTSEFDQQMCDIVNMIWPLLEQETRNTVIKYIEDKILQNKKNECDELVTKYSGCVSWSISDLLNEREFTSVMKTRLLNKILNCSDSQVNQLQSICKNVLDLGDCSTITFCDKYENDVTWYRNKLAHVKKVECSDGAIFVGKRQGKDIFFDENLCNLIRKNLLLYKELFDSIYEMVEEM